ncbi:MAG: 30S ribosomal protein S7 [Nanoarchaeota archaeon]|nr:30S ribosomal protein S7 [Nanoarchaeota archaeon]
MTIKVFNKWDVEGITIQDPALVNYINLEPKIVPKTGARYAGQRFHKSRTFIVERLINKVMVSGHKSKKHLISSGHNSGKKDKAYKAVMKAFEIIEQKLKINPVEVFAYAVELAAPREEIVAIEYGGARYPKAVEVAPQRRIDLALRYMTQGAHLACFNKKTSLANALANEIIEAYKGSPKSTAISKKRDSERQAASSK